MIPKHVDAITKEDITSLVVNEVREGRTLEYKEALPGGTDDEKREFLADVSSFANAAGGDLIYGIRERRDTAGKATGIPEAAEGLSIANPDAEKQRLEAMLLNGIEPRIPGLRLTYCEGLASGAALILRVPRSWISPHMVTFRNLSRFFSRTSAGKYQLDVRELRDAFLASDAVSQRIAAFRSDRLGKIWAKEGALPLEDCPKVVLHLLPVSSFGDRQCIDLRDAVSLPQQHVLPIGRGNAVRSHFNCDGFITFLERKDAEVFPSYLQLFRTGSIEAVCTQFVKDEEIRIAGLEQELHKAIGRYRLVQGHFGVGLPLCVAISIVGAKGLTIRTADNRRNHRCSRPIDRDIVMAPEVVINEEGSDVWGVLRPAFDGIWQACGWPRSEAYLPSGKRVGSVRYEVEGFDDPPA